MTDEELYELARIWLNTQNIEVSAEIESVIVRAFKAGYVECLYIQAKRNKDRSYK